MEYQQSMFWIKNKEYRDTLVNPSFTIQKWGSMGYAFHGHVFLMKYLVPREEIIYDYLHVC